MYLNTNPIDTQVFLVSIIDYKLNSRRQLKNVFFIKKRVRDHIRPTYLKCGFFFSSCVVVIDKSCKSSFKFGVDIQNTLEIHVVLVSILDCKCCHMQLENRCLLNENSEHTKPKYVTQSNLLPGELVSLKSHWIKRHGVYDSMVCRGDFLNIFFKSRKTISKKNCC